MPLNKHKDIQDQELLWHVDSCPTDSGGVEFSFRFSRLVVPLMLENPVWLGKEKMDSCLFLMILEQREIDLEFELGWGFPQTLYYLHPYVCVCVHSAEAKCGMIFEKFFLFD